MNVEIGAEAALFPEKEYMKGIFFAVLYSTLYMHYAPNPVVSFKRNIV